jgi:predicted nucleic acid-binding protein
MNEIFVDTLYLVARLNPKDQWHKAAKEIEHFIKDKLWSQLSQF